MDAYACTLYICIYTDIDIHLSIHEERFPYTCVCVCVNLRACTSVCMCMQQAAAAETARATPGTRGPTAARAQRARQARTRPHRVPQNAARVPPTPRRLQVCAGFVRRTCWRTNAYTMPMLRRRICRNACIRAIASVSEN